MKLREMFAVQTKRMFNVAPTGFRKSDQGTKIL